MNKDLYPQIISELEPQGQLEISPLHDLYPQVISELTTGATGNIPIACTRTCTLRELVSFYHKGNWKYSHCMTYTLM